MKKPTFCGVPIKWVNKLDSCDTRVYMNKHPRDMSDMERCFWARMCNAKQAKRIKQGLWP